MIEKWYTVGEIKRWTEADSRGFGEHAEWLAAQLNAAFIKGGQVHESALKTAVDELSEDLHEYSTRPCSTCAKVSRALGRPFGCLERRRAFVVLAEREKAGGQADPA